MMNKQYIQHTVYLEALQAICECEEEILTHTRLLDEAFYGFGPSPSAEWEQTTLCWIDFHKYCLAEFGEVRVRYESEQHKLRTLKECKSKKPLGWHDIGPDDIDFDDIDSPNFFDVQFANPWE